MKLGEKRKTVHEVEIHIGRFISNLLVGGKQKPKKIEKRAFKRERLFELLLLLL